MARTKQIDTALVRELKLYATNTSDIYFKRVIPLLENYTRKYVRGSFDKAKAVKGYQTVVVEDAIRRYRKAYGLGPVGSAEKKAIAEELYDFYEDIMKEMFKKAKKLKK